MNVEDFSEGDIKTRNINSHWRLNLKSDGLEAEKRGKLITGSVGPLFQLGEEYGKEMMSWISYGTLDEELMKEEDLPDLIYQTGYEIGTQSTSSQNTIPNKIDGWNLANDLMKISNGIYYGATHSRFSKIKKFLDGVNPISGEGLSTFKDSNFYNMRYSSDPSRNEIYQNVKQGFLDGAGNNIEEDLSELLDENLY